MKVETKDDISHPGDEEEKMARGFSIKLSRTSLQRFGLLLLLTVQNTVTVLCLHYSRTRNNNSKSGSAAEGKDGSTYFVSSLVLTMEVLKYVITVCFLIAQLGCSVSSTAQVLYREIIHRPVDTLQMALPALLYIAQDNLLIYSLEVLDAATYQVTYQLRILTTAFFAKVVLDKQLNTKHWTALVMLMIGVILAQLHFDESKKGFSFRSDKEGGEYFLGLLCVGCATMTSGFAGVYNEKMMKNGQQPLLFVRSLQINTFAVVFAGLGVLIKDGERVWRLGFFHGFDGLTLFIALVQAAGGIIVAATVKYADNILKTFATAISIIMSCILSYWIFGDLNSAPTFTLGTIIIIASTIIYSRASMNPKQVNVIPFSSKKSEKNDSD